LPEGPGLGTAAAEPIAAPSSRTLFLAVFPSIMLPMFLAAIDQTIIATALPAMAAQLGDVERVSWVVVSYLVAATIAAPVYGRLGDVLGRRRLMFVALTVFIVASVLCAIAPSILALTAARVLQGFGGGGLMTLSQALVGEAVPPRERGRFQGYLATVFVCSSTFGPVAGGWLTQHFGWTSVFLINVPLGLIALAVALRLPRRPPSGAYGGRLHFDFIGLGLFAGFIAPMLLAVEQAQRFDPATLPLAAGLAAVAVASLMLLLRQERRARMPLLPVKLLAQAGIWRSNALAACLGAHLVSLITFLPIYLQVVRGASPGHAGVLLLPLTMLIAIGSLFTGRMISYTGYGAIFPSFGMPIVSMFVIALAFLAPRLGFGQLPFLFAAIALFSGTAMPVVQTTVQFISGPKQLGAGAASVQFSRTIGAAIGTAVVGAVLFATLAATDPDAAHLFAAIVETGPRALAGLPADRVAILQGEIAHAFRAAFLTIACFGALGGVMAWTIPVRRIG
jgi:EmrB/QacA subfamily drug resistance transporter